MYYVLCTIHYIIYIDGTVYCVLYIQCTVYSVHNSTVGVLKRSSFRTNLSLCKSTFRIKFCLQF
jgi:hypothetical protein